MLKKELLDILCCPKCKGDLKYDSKKNTLTCKACGSVYAVKDDIPIMLPPAQEKPSQAR
ncbi:MAG TPA: Trm112 family protein [Bacteroidota bacterium]|nr:Trm112 family protein [Bacteroidota bacterium]